MRPASRFRPRSRRILPLLLVCTLAGVSAQAPPSATAPAATTAPADGGSAGAISDVRLLVGRSIVLDVPDGITRVSLTRPEVADALVTSPRQLLVHGKAVGTISMLVWAHNGGLRRFEVSVRRDLTALHQQFEQLFPGEPIAVSESGKDLVIAGVVSSKYVIEKAADVAAGYVDKKDDVVNLLRLQEGVATNQVLLRVRFAEVSRTALQELGTSFFTGATGYKDWIGRVTTQQFSAPSFSDLSRTEVNGKVTNLDGKMSFSDFLNLFLFNTKYNVGTLVRALQNRGVFQSLAEPNLIAENGKEASFLAGGEYPYPVVQGSGANLAISITFKEFGIRLNFTPTVLAGDLVNLKVRPEVSSLDFSNALTMQGFRIPALMTRRAETEVELADGQTFAIAGLLNNTMTSTLQKVPGIGDIPVLGLLFRSKAAQKAQTELVVLITPQILKRGSTGAAPGLPGMIEPFLPPAPKTVPPPPPYGPRGNGDDAAGVTPAAAPPASGAVQPSANASPAPVNAAPETTASAPALTEQERRMLEQSRKTLKAQQEAEAKAAREQQQREAKQAEAVRKREAKAAQEKAKRDAELAREEQKREAEAAKERERLAAKAKKEQAERELKEAREAAERAKLEEERDRAEHKQLTEAEQRLKEAMEAYQAALAKSKKNE